MKTLISIQFIFALLITLSACKKTDNDIQPSLSISPTQKKLESGQGSFMIAIAANVKWIASTDESWLSLSPISGTGDGTIQVDYQINTSPTPRTAVITFKGSNLEDKYLTVTQSGVSPFLTVTPQNQNVSAAAGSTKFAVSSNTNWIVSSDPLWCTLSQTSGTGNVELTATYQENTLSTQRTATLTFKVTGLADQYATVTQAAFVPSLFVSPSNQNVGSAAGSTSFNVAANIAWTVTSNHPEWCTLNTGGTGNGTINANFTENTSSNPRIADITVSGVGVLGQVVTVTQSGNTLSQGLVAYYPFNGNANDESGNGNNGTVNGATLTTDRKGNENCAYSFDGINDRIANIYFSVTNNFTICIWAKTNTYHEIDQQATSGSSGMTGQKYAIFPSHGNAWGAGHAGLGISVGINGVSVYEHAEAYMPAVLVKEFVENNSWMFIVIKVVDKQSNLYVNGVLLKTGLTSLKNYVHPSFNIGGYDYGYFIGQLDDVRIYDRALTESEIQALYNE